MRDWEENKAQVLARLRRAEGQLRAVIRMVEREDDCERTAQQLSAARKALDRAFYDMLACAMRRQFTDLGLDSPRARSELAHMTELLTRYG
ncbi:MAG TPA: metal-sensing transcriptional repressor [Nevskiales bacterium]|nr:metal-sensing transcriptional repressor [Nevskiales bacterium]